MYQTLECPCGWQGSDAEAPDGNCPKCQGEELMDTTPMLADAEEILAEAEAREKEPPKLEGRGYIGGGHAGAILGVDPYRSQLKAYQQIVEPQPKRERSQRIEVGILLEDDILELYDQERRPLEWLRRGGDFEQEPLIHPVHKFIQGHPDGLVRFREGLVIPEAKTANERMRKLWEGQPPETYIAQGCLYLELVPEAIRVDFAVLWGDFSFEVISVHRDNELIAMVIEGLVAFYRDHIEPRIPPPPRTEEDLLALFPREKGDMRDATEDSIKLVQEINTRDASVKVLSEERDALALAVKLLVGPAPGIRLDNGKPLVTWKKAKDADVFDAKRFQEDHPELWDAYQTKRPGGRVFLPKKVG